ncbi:MAG TPA: FtsX-like permease family protein [Bacteroidales bacterium]|nr:FtsX-like permease family protein [Bacteroidales bacterium]
MKYVFKELRRHLWRTVLSISGYIIATLFIILIIAVTHNNKKDTDTILMGIGTHFTIYVPSGMPYNNVPFDTTCCTEPEFCIIVSGENQSSVDFRNGSLYSDGVYTKLLSRNFLNQVRQVKGVRDAAPYLLYKRFEDHYKADVSIGGMDPGSIATQNNVCAPNDIIEGKFLPSDTSEVVAEESFARAFNLHIGDTLYYCDKELRLVGIINSGVKPGKADLYTTFDNLKYILKDQLKLNMSGFDLNVILVEVEDSRNQAEVMEAIKIQNQYASLSSYNCYKPSANVMSIIGKASAILYGIIFLFLIVFAAKTQTTSLMERLREIGILKSMGWSNRRLGGQIVAGSLIQALVGSIFGCVLSLITLSILNYFQIQLVDNSVLNIQFTQLLFVCSLALVGALLASLFPIIKIWRLSAGDIMRSYL